jgi:uncharacterized protein YigE (DUF2233 family)
MRREWIIPAAFLACMVAGGILLFRELEPDRGPDATSPRRAPEPTGQPDTSRFVSLMLKVDADPIGMYWRDTDGRDIRSLGKLRDYEEERGNRLRFAMNGGMYRKDHSPVGLFIQNGHVLSPLDTSDGKGNFYLKPNGVFLVRKDRTATIVTTDRFIYTGDIAFATQSGPMLLIEGAIHPVFEKDSEHLNIRNGVGVKPDGTVVFAISLTTVTLYDFAMYFRNMGCRDALYLDGFVSRCYLPEKNLMQLDGDFGVMIGVVEGDAKF